MAPKVLNVLIVGATSAIASEVARNYANQGAQLFLLARNEQKLQALATELGPSVIGFEAGDLNELDQNQGRVERALQALGPLHVALVAHGFLGDQIRSETELDHALEILTTNLSSAVSILIPLANQFEAQGSGHLGVITSVAGERGRPRNYTYGAAKGGLTRYLQGLRSRLYGSGVHILNIKLGPADTPMTADHEKHFLFGEKTKVAQGIVRALSGRKHVVYLKGAWYPVMSIVRGLPEFIFQRFGFLSGR
ncbi:MAG: decaprenylphospho-beta-D-erythro-pentofuranosid-2-ulose 2-reductase [Planctomycetota bacterium]|jgi:decaprenylphospho-beta-D-erythro-pentofuranosid-2-ulose 2-reductase